MNDFCRSFENIIVPKTLHTPYLILFYSDWCFACLQVEPIWRRLIDELEPLGLGLATAHAEKESALARKLGIHSLPCLVVTIDGRTSVYKESLFSIQKIVGMYYIIYFIFLLCSVTELNCLFLLQTSYETNFHIN